eukprot:TRINITY_DN62375_c0_g1_i1.p1 TRINITY_DN62375_c0_g1~~TRINITY_DN62375_c0_g1_i1.p1  ORF type:complete len:335 (+),score=54.79 TRINITY_DN62375_c0_g1_i1:32-1036(+)
MRSPLKCSRLCSWSFVLLSVALVRLPLRSFVGFGCSTGAHKTRRALRAPGASVRRAAEGELRPVVLCPAQFGTEEDYEDLKVELRSRGFALYPAPLSRFDWLKIVPSTLTKEFFTAELRPGKTLGFFYEALDKALMAVEADFGKAVPVAFLGHSIGGWVARSYIGEVLGDQAASRVCSLVTLGTPHNAPPRESWASALDQTRGLLTYINEQFPSGSPLPPSAVTCVAGSGTLAPDSVGALLDGAGDRIWDESVTRSRLLEEIVAFASYFPLSGKTGAAGDGLIPVETALMTGCGSLVLDDCNHADFVPTPGPSLRLPKSYKWYGDFMDQWVKFL